MNPFKLKSTQSRPRTQHKRKNRKNVDGRRFRRYEDDDPDFKCHVKMAKPIADNYVRQMGKNIILF